MCPKDADGMANSVWTGSTLFAQIFLSENLRSLGYLIMRQIKDIPWVCYGLFDLTRNVDVIYMVRYNKNELVHNKTNEMTCIPSKDSDQPGHPPSLIRLPCLHQETFVP